LARAFAEGIHLGSYRFDPYKTGANEKKAVPLRSATLFLPGRKGARQAASAAHLGEVVATSANLARDLGNTPSNDATPSYLARTAQGIARKRKLSCRVMNEAEMKRLRMGALLGVARGSREKPRFIILEHRGKRAAAETIVLVGKGITFDSGGISLKPPLKMEDMKFDMCGGAAVLGILDAVGQLGLKNHIVGLVPCTENLPGGSAQKPGDVVRTLSGKTIEVINTDAEGRLILADALAYAKRYRPAAVIDLATLTGACIIALGHHAGALMGTDDRLNHALLGAGERTGERIWQLPIWPEYKKQIESVVADVKNTGGRPAGSITAALFLKEFIGDYPWAHLDIAGVAWTEMTSPIQDKGATGFGVRLVVDYLLDREAK
ncbi:MAG: leucyl aminopeptidase, partial [Planctomycetota bacterium]|nr:leucyl aminopeptidase [Planctomycetota bacterium]